MRRLLSLMTVALLLAACAGGETWHLAEADSLGEFSVASGDTIEVTLEENPSTGYVWDPAVIPEMLTLRSDAFIEADTDLVGAPGEHVFVLEADEKGAGILRFEYVRPFDDPVVPDRVVEFVVVVDEAPWPPEQGSSSPSTSTATVPPP